MQLIITDAWLAKSRAMHLSGAKLILVALLASLTLMLVQGIPQDPQKFLPAGRNLPNQQLSKLVSAADLDLVAPDESGGSPGKTLARAKVKSRVWFSKRCVFRSNGCTS